MIEMSLSICNKDPLLLVPTEIWYMIFEFLADGWPVRAREWFSHRRHLGWMTVTHVSRGWRNLAKGMNQLWGRDVCALYSRRAISEFIQRAGHAPLTIDFDRLQRASHRRVLDSGILGLLISADNLSRARIVRSDFHQRSKELASAVSSMRFSSLTTLEVCLPKSTISLEEFSAPLIHTLALRSDATKSREAPVMYSTLLSILSRCPRISKLRLDHAVGNPTAASGSPMGDALLPNRIDELSVSSFDEEVVTNVIYHIGQDRHRVHNLEFDAVSNISSAHSITKTAILDSKCAITVSHGILGALDGADTSYSDYFAIRAHYYGTHLNYRLHWQQTEWGWSDLVETMGSDSITTLTIHGIGARGEDAPPPELDLPELLSRLHHVETVELEGVAQVYLLHSLPKDCPLKSLTIQCECYPVPYELKEWIVDEGRVPGSLDVTLRGESWSTGDAESNFEEEYETLTEIRKVCRVYDNRLSITDV